MGFPKVILSAQDWRDIQNAVSNSDLETDRRMRLLDKIGVKLQEAENVEAARKAAEEKK